MELKRKFKQMKNRVMKSKSFYSHHSPWGCLFSFVIGKIDRGGGFIIDDVIPRNDNIYIGYKKGNEKIRLFPFFNKIKIDTVNERYQCSFGNQTVEWCWKNVKIFKEKDIERNMKWSTESWTAEDITLTIITPFMRIPDPQTLDNEKARFYFCPCIFIQLEFDNSRSDEEMIGMFALRGMRRLLSDSTRGNLLGFAYKGTHGFAAIPDKDIKENSTWWGFVSNSLNHKGNTFKMANEGGLSFKISPYKKKKYTIALAAYRDGCVTTGIKSYFYYTQYFSDLEDVLYYALSNFDKYYSIALKNNEKLDSSNLNNYKKFMISHSTRSYMANTEFLIDESNTPRFIVYEGEYKLINTLDLIIDQVFWEMYFTPWTVKNELESFVKDYTYEDFVTYKDGTKKKGEICFYHDQGIHNMFTSGTSSAYELSGGINGGFSYMTCEEILNWLLTASIYGIKGNNRAWLQKNFDVFCRLFNSIIVRDENDDGVMDKQSSKCETGAEITTYDGLGTGREPPQNNLYIAVKTWAGYICLENIFRILDEQELLEKVKTRSMLCASTVISNYDKKKGYIPAILGTKNKLRMINAIEGLIYPYIIGDNDAISFEGRFGKLIEILKLHLENILVPGVCLNSKTKGWQLFSTSKNTWLSKIIINQFVAKKILKIQRRDWEDWDKIHAQWQQTGCSFYAATDQIDCYTGKALGSKVYPRLVTSLLWLKY